MSLTQQEQQEYNNYRENYKLCFSKLNDYFKNNDIENAKLFYNKYFEVAHTLFMKSIEYTNYIRYNIFVYENIEGIEWWNEEYFLISFARQKDSYMDKIDIVINKRCVLLLQDNENFIKKLINYILILNVKVLDKRNYAIYILKEINNTGELNVKKNTTYNEQNILICKINKQIYEKTLKELFIDFIEKNDEISINYAKIIVESNANIDFNDLLYTSFRIYDISCLNFNATKELNLIKFILQYVKNINFIKYENENENIKYDEFYLLKRIPFFGKDQFEILNLLLDAYPNYPNYALKTLINVYSNHIKVKPSQCYDDMSLFYDDNFNILLFLNNYIDNIEK